MDSTHPANCSVIDRGEECEVRVADINQGLIYMSRSSVGSGRVASGLTVRVFISNNEVIALVWCSIFPGRPQPCQPSEIRLTRRKAAGFPQSGAAKALNVKLTDSD